VSEPGRRAREETSPGARRERARLVSNRRARYWAVVRTVAWRNLHSVIRAPALLLPMLAFPLFFYMAFAGGLSAVGSLPGFNYYNYDAFQFVFVLLQSAAFGGVFIGFSIGADFDSGFTRRLMLAARDRSAVIAGFGVAAVIRAVFVWAVVFAIALATGMDVGGNGIDLVGLIGLALVVNVAAFLFAAGVMTRLRTLQAAPAMQLPLFMILMTAPVYVPRNLLEGWISSVATVNPMTAIVESGRSLMAGDPFHVLLAFAAAAGLAALLSVFALRGLRKAEAAG
jgi:ABC-type multidrug transport system permease subunit